MTFEELTGKIARGESPRYEQLVDFRFVVQIRKHADLSFRIYT